MILILKTFPADAGRVARATSLKKLLRDWAWRRWGIQFLTC